MADNCGSYVNAEDLKAAKESINHIEHVATSKDADGNPALVVTDPIRGTNYTNKTLEGFFARLGFLPVDGSFQTGGTLNNRWDVLLNTADNSYYQWMGSLPKVVPAGSTPATSGGVSASAWVNQTDLTLRSQLAAASGIDLIGGMSSEARPGYGLKFGDTSGIPTINVRDATDQRILLSKDVTHPDDYSVLQINRTANYSGGTTGFVGSALRVQTDVSTPSSASTFEWAGLFILNNQVPATVSGSGPGAVPQQVALYGQANKNATSATWAGCFEINDNYYDGTVAKGQSVGIELTVRGVGADSSIMSRVGMHVAAHTPEGSTGAEWGAAYFATSDTTKNVRFRHGLRVEGLIGDSLIYNSAGTDQASAALIRDAGALTIGIDLSAATYGSGVAMRLKNSMRISFDGADTNQIYGSTSGIITKGKLNMQNSFAIPASGNTSTAATAGGVASLPATVAGFVNFYVDGVVKKIPFYN